jgi:hypothetical protein
VASQWFYGGTKTTVTMTEALDKSFKKKRSEKIEVTSEETMKE